jgi:hypothetical protein
MVDKPTTVTEYLASLPEDRRAAINAVRDVFRANMDSGYEEGITYGMIGYYVPHSLYPAGYHCDPKMPLPFANLGSQKNYMSLHMMCMYSGGDSDGPAASLQDWFRTAWAKSGKKLDMGKACIRFKRLEDLPLDVIGQAIAKVPASKWIAMNQKYAEMRQNSKADTKAKAKTKK